MSLLSFNLFSAAQANHLASSEIPLTLLFQNSPAKLGRSLSSARAPQVDTPSLTFKNKIPLNARGEAHLGPHCYIRNTSLAQSAGSNYLSSALNQTQGGSVPAGNAFFMNLISFQSESLQILLHPANHAAQRYELSCAHPNIQSWSVSEFEASSNHLFHVRIPASLAASAKKIVQEPRDSFSLQELKGSLFNGVFGSGLPGTMGIQLLLGANLKAYAEETNAPLMVGHRCKLVSQANEALESQYIKGSKFAFREYRVKHGKVELVFDNWNHSPHQVRVECRGSESEVKAMSVAEVEHDLNGIIQFYKK